MGHNYICVPETLRLNAVHALHQPLPLIGGIPNSWGRRLIARGLYSCGVYTYGVYSYGLHSYGVYSYGLYSYGLYGHGQHSYGRLKWTNDLWLWI